jgi:hypothetical protein
VLHVPDLLLRQIPASPAWFALLEQGREQRRQAGFLNHMVRWQSSRDKKIHLYPKRRISCLSLPMRRVQRHKGLFMARVAHGLKQGKTWHGKYDLLR